MDKQPIKRTVRNVLDKTLVFLGKNPENFSDTDDLLKSGALDSFAYLDFIGDLEDTLNIEIDVAALNEEMMISVQGLSLEIERIQAANT
jgi:acyl carrier protein